MFLGPMLSHGVCVAGGGGTSGAGGGGGGLDGTGTKHGSAPAHVTFTDSGTSTCRLRSLLAKPN